MCVLIIFLKLECFAWKCHPRTDVNRKPQRWLHVHGDISKRWRYKITSVRLGIGISKMRKHKTKLALRYHHLQTLCPRPFWRLRNSLTSFCDKTVRLCEPVSVNCPSESEKLHCLDITQVNEAIEATKLQSLSQDSMEQQTVSKEACESSSMISRISFLHQKCQPLDGKPD